VPTVTRNTGCDASQLAYVQLSGILTFLPGEDGDNEIVGIDNYSCHVAISKHLGPQLHQIAWSAASNEPTADPWGDVQGSLQERRAGSLKLLRVYSQMVKILQRRIDLTTKEALAAGSSYGEIAEACGVSRQAIRQRSLRRSQAADVRLPSPPPESDLTGSWTSDGQPLRPVFVRLAGGPRDGDWNRVMPGHVTRFRIQDQSADPIDSVSQIAWYVPSEDDAGVYVFAGLEPHDDSWPADQADAGETVAPPTTPAFLMPQTPATGAPMSTDSSGGRMARKPLVRELAAEFGVDSKIVMAKLQEMGEFIRSASSTVERPAARRLREQFATRRAPQRPEPRPTDPSGNPH
jgi:hypothetical protein